MHFLRLLLRPGLAAALALSAVAALAQGNFPDRTIRLIVPLAAGGGGDIVARLIAGKLTPVLGQSVVVDNRAGGASVIGSDMVAKAAPDGYTLLMATSSHVINGSLIKLPYDSVKDFAGVSLIATSPLMLVVNSKTPVKSVPELIALGKASPKGLTYASSGLGGLPHLSGELLARSANLKLVHVPYKGSGPAESDLLGGQIDMYFASPSSVVPHVKSGALRALAMTGVKRSAAFPDLPAMSEFYPAFESGAGTLYAIIAPAGTPQPVLDKLSTAIRGIIEQPDVKERLTALGADLVGSNPADTMKFIDQQVRLWDKLVKEANIKAN